MYGECWNRQKYLESHEEETLVTISDHSLSVMDLIGTRNFNQSKLESSFQEGESPAT